MMTTHVYVEFNDFAKYADNMQGVARKAVATTIKRIEARAKASLSGPRSGRTYRRGAISRSYKATGKRAAELSMLGFRGSLNVKTGKFTFITGYRVHRASAPGEAPATDTGNLGNSIGSRMIGKTEGEVTVTAEYAAALELGSPHIAPRPFFAPAVKAEWPGFLAAMKAIAE